MPLCHRHNVQIVTDVYGVSKCPRCEDEKRFEEARYCRRCAEPVPAPGLCANCARSVRREQALYSLGQNAWWIVIVLFLIALGLVFVMRPLENFAPPPPP